VIANGESVTISWESVNAEAITLETSSSQNTGVGPNGSVILRPTHHETITLTARNGYAVISKTIEVLVGPAITNFSVAPATIATGGETVIRWETTGSDQIVESNHFPATAVSAPVRFTPTNLNLIASDATWKQAPATPGEGWQSIDYDDSAWSDAIPPFESNRLRSGLAESSRCNRIRK
jgi:hypothetical protein